MLICELMFDRPDQDNPKYSQHEVDYYAWIPANAQVPNHRLSLRKNLETGFFEVYRRFFQRRVVVAPNLIGVTGDDTGLEEIAFEGEFEDALEFANNEYKRWHGDNEPDKPCQHHYPNQAFTCAKRFENTQRKKGGDSGNETIGETRKTEISNIECDFGL